VVIAIDLILKFKVVIAKDYDNIYRTGHDMVGGYGGLTTKCYTTGGVWEDIFLLSLLALTFFL